MPSAGGAPGTDNASGPPAPVSVVPVPVAQPSIGRPKKTVRQSSGDTKLASTPVVQPTTGQHTKVVQPDVVQTAPADAKKPTTPVKPVKPAPRPAQLAQPVQPASPTLSTQPAPIIKAAQPAPEKTKKVVHLDVSTPQSNTAPLEAAKGVAEGCPHMMMLGSSTPGTTTGCPHTTMSSAQGSCIGQSLATRMGDEKVRQVVEEFYKRMLADPEIKPFFVGFDVAKLRAKQFRFLSYVFGAPAAKPPDLRAVHLPMIVKQGLSFAHFDKATVYLAEALRQANVAEEDVAEINERIVATRPHFAPATPEEAAGVSTAPPSKTLYELLGDAAVKAVVDMAHKKVIGHPQLKSFFEGLDMNTLRRKQAQFLCHAFGGPAPYTGKDMRAVHLPLIRDKGLTVEHFDLFLQQFAITMEELRVPTDNASKAMEVLRGMRQHFEPPTAGEDGQFVVHEEEADLSRSLYERLGGEVFTKDLADRMYKKLTTDNRVNYFFQGIDVGRLKGKVSFMMQMMFGAPGVEYPGGMSVLRAKHTNLIKYKGLAMEHFEIYKLHFTNTLKEMQASATTIREAEGLLEVYRQLFKPMGDSELKQVMNNNDIEMKSTHVIDIEFTGRHFCTTC